MARLHYNGLYGTLGASLSNSATSVTLAGALTHSGGTNVPTISGGQDYLPLSILDSAGALSEVVYVTAYTSGATTATISRGQEGTTGVSHASGLGITHAPTAADFGGAVLALGSPVEGSSMLVYGHSYSTASPPQATNNVGYIQRLTARLGLKNQLNHAVSSKTSWDEALNQTSGDLGYIMNGGNLLHSDAVVNDCFDAEGTGGGTTAPLQAKSVAKITNMKKFLISLSRRSAAPIYNTSGSCTYTGTWTSNAAGMGAYNYSSGATQTSHSTTTQNDFVTVTGLTAGGKYAVVLQGIDDSANGTAGAAFSITATGMTTITGTTSNQFFLGRDTGIFRAPQVVIVQLPAGVTSLVVTKTDASGSKLYFNAVHALYTAAGTGPWVFLMKAPYVTNGLLDATVDRLNAGVDAAATAFGGLAEGIVVLDPNAAGWNKTTMIGADQIHPNDRGYAFLANLEAVTANTLNYGVTTSGSGRNTTQN